MTYDAVVAGGGIAGCSAATLLAKQGFQVLLLEKQQYPAHKLCGEFLSVEVAEAFHRLGVLEVVQNRRPARMERALITVPNARPFSAFLPGTALGLSRYCLDDVLLRHAEQAGVHVRQAEAVQEILGDLEKGFMMETAQAAYSARMVFGAYGKRSTLDRKLQRPFLQRDEPFVAFKAHFRGPGIGPVIELHAFSGGYCGLSPIEDGLINVCWIATEETLRRADGSADVLIEHACRQNPVLAERMAGLERAQDRYLAISQISFAPKDKFDGDVCMVGDAAGMITPLCGDGMSMAIRSAELAVPVAARFLRGYIDIQTLKGQYKKAWEREFRFRMALGRFIHYGFIQPVVARLGLTGLAMFPALGAWLIRRTRG
jgi:menaquinone-9 beta-reductase